MVFHRLEILLESLLWPLASGVGYTKIWALGQRVFENKFLDSHFPCVLVTKIPLPQDILDPFFFPYTLYVHFKCISSLSVLVNVLPIFFYLRT